MFAARELQLSSELPMPVPISANVISDMQPLYVDSAATSETRYYLATPEQTRRLPYHARVGTQVRCWHSLEY